MRFREPTVKYRTKTRGRRVERPAEVREHTLLETDLVLSSDDESGRTFCLILTYSMKVLKEKKRKEKKKKIYSVTE